MKPIVVVGSINIDLVANVPRIPVVGETLTSTAFEIHHGGKGANQAVAVGRLGYPVAMIGRVGSDAFGEKLRHGLQQDGVDTSAVTTTEGPSGNALILVNAEGNNSIVVTPGANGLLTPADLDAQIELIRSAGLVLSQLEVPLETVLRLTQLCRQESIPLILDPAPAAAVPPEVLSAVTWFTPNETEAAFYTPDLSADASSDQRLQALFAQGIKGVILKRGEHGSRIATQSGFDAAIAAFPVKAIDTTAAGDCFNGAFATALMRGQSPIEAALFASAAAAISVTRKGAQPSLPTMDEVNQLLQNQS